MQQRCVWQHNLALRDPHVDQPATKGAQRQSTGHADVTPGCIDNHVAHPPVGQLCDRLFIIVGTAGKVRLNARQPRTHSFQTHRDAVHHDRTRSGENGKLQHRQTDWTSADHQHGFALSGRGAVDGMAADRQSFHEGILCMGQAGRGVQLPGW